MIPPVRMWLRMRQSLAHWTGVDLTHSQNRYFSKLQEIFPDGGRWLDIGCGHQIVPEWAGSAQSQRELAAKAGLFVGADLDVSIREHDLLQHGVFASAAGLPFGDESLDVVTANMVVEHLDDPAAAFAEIRRTLRPGGAFVFHTPNYHFYGIFAASFIPDGLKNKIIWLLERREEKDVFHTYYRANTAASARRLLLEAGFDHVEIAKTPSTGMLQFLGPLGVLEILWLKLLRWTSWNTGRATLIAVARRAPSGEPRTAWLAGLESCSDLS